MSVIPLKQRARLLLRVYMPVGWIHWLTRHVFLIGNIFSKRSFTFLCGMWTLLTHCERHNRSQYLTTLWERRRKSRGERREVEMRVDEEQDTKSEKFVFHHNFSAAIYCLLFLGSFPKSTVSWKICLPVTLLRKWHILTSHSLCALRIPWALAHCTYTNVEHELQFRIA